MNRSARAGVYSLRLLFRAEKFVAVEGGVAHGRRDTQALVVTAEPV
jgi:hypothetical protein